MEHRGLNMRTAEFMKVPVLQGEKGAHKEDSKPIQFKQKNSL